MLKKLPTMYTTDNTSEKLYWVVEGTKPIPGLHQKIINQDERISELEENIIDHK